MVAQQVLVLFVQVRILVRQQKGVIHKNDSFCFSYNIPIFLSKSYLIIYFTTYMQVFFIIHDKKIYFISLFIFTLQKISENLNKMKIRAFGTQIVIFGILLFISNSVSAQSSSHNTGEPIDKSHHRTTEDTRGNKILSGEMLRRTSIGNLWNAILSLEPSLTDGNSDLYGDVPYYIPQNTSLQGQTAWSFRVNPHRYYFLSTEHKYRLTNSCASI